MDNHTAFKQLSAALSHAINEHGAPNSFSPGELSAYHCNVSPLVIGRLARGGWIKWIEAEVRKATDMPSLTVAYNGGKPCVFRVEV